MRRATLLLVALVLAVIGQNYLARNYYPFDAVVFYVAAVLVAWWAFRGLPEQPRPALPEPEPWTRRRSALLAGAVVVNAVALLIFYRLERSNLGLVLLVASVLLLVAACWPIGLGRRLTRAAHADSEPASSAMRVATSIRQRVNLWEVGLLAGVLLLALFMRVYRLDSIPSGLYLDEGDNGFLGLSLFGQQFSPYTPARESSNATMYFYFLGLVARLFGPSVLVMRLAAVTVGMLTVIAFYPLARLLFGWRVALVITFLLAVSRWHVTFSRLLFEALPVPLFALLTAYFLLRGLKTGQRLSFALGGLAFGLGVHTYIGYRVFPAAIVLFLLAKAASDWPTGLGRRLTLAAHADSDLGENEESASIRVNLRPVQSAVRGLWGGLAVFAIAAWLTFAPLGIFVPKHPEVFLRRIQAASVQQDIQREHSYAPLWSNVRKTIGMFNYHGDPRPRHNLPNAPELDHVSAILFALGAGYALLRLRQPEHVLLVSWLVLGFLPGILSLTDSNPHSMRTIINIPVVYLLAGVFVERLWAVAAQIPRWRAQRALAVLLLPVLAFSGYANAHTYFVKQANDRSVWYDFDPVQTQVAEYVKAMSTPHPGPRLIVSSWFTNYSAMKFLDYGVPYQTFNQAAHLPLREVSDRDAIYVLEPAIQQLLPLFQSYYPQGTLSEVRDRYQNLAFYTFKVTKEQQAATQGLQGRYFRGGDWAGEPVLERREATLDFNWASPPLDPPFSAEWQSNLYAPRYGQYVLILDSTSPASLTLDDQEILESGSGLRRKGLLLPGGFHALRVRTAVSEASGGLHLRWTAPGITEQVIPPTALYTLELAGNGLLGKYYQGNNWAGAPVYTQKDLFIFPNDLVPAPFSIEWEGKIYAPRAGTYTFGTLSDDGSLLYLDGKLVVDNGGHHADRYVENRVTLTEGLHDLRLRYFQDDGGRRMELWWIPPGGAKEMVPVAYLFPPGVAPTTPPTAEFQVPSSTLTPTPTPTWNVEPGTPTGTPQPPMATTPSAVPQLGTVGLLATWGRAGSGPGEFRDPRGVAVDAQGRLYVADTGNRRVQVLDASGQYLAQWAGPSPAFVEPCAVAVSPQGQVYVLDTQADVAYRFSAQGEPQGTLGAGSGLYRPRGIAVDREGNVYIANTGGNNVVKFSATGEVLAQIGRAGKGNGQLDQPCDVAVDEQGNIYVVDTLNQRVQRFDRTGRYQGQWPLTRSDTAYAAHLALAAGIVYVTEPEGGRLLAYSAGGALLGVWGSPGTGEGQFTKPVGLAIDSRGRLFVADAGNHRVQVWGAQ